MRPAFLSALLLALPLVVSAQSFEQHLPKSGIIKGSVMVVGGSPELEALSKRLQAALAANPEWLKGYIEKAGSKELPYHKNFGLTEEEYKRFLDLSKTGMSLQRAASVEITLKRSSDGTLTFVTVPGEFPLNGVTISANGGIAVTPYGRLNRGSDINQRDAKAPTGRWSGARWAHENTTDPAPWSAQLSIGTREDFKDGIIYYNATRLGGATPGKLSFVILYPLR
jgi:hypothetical protein